MMLKEHTVHTTSKRRVRTYTTSESQWTRRVDGGGGVVSNFVSSFNISAILAHLFLPVGYPHSVRPEYLTYQIWDSVQGLSSYVRGVLTTRSVLQGAGVGSAESSAVAAALVWMLKDGLGMMGSLIFAYYFSEIFEVNTKEWRLSADVLNNIGLTLDLLSGMFPKHYLWFTATSAVSKSCCWVVAGATKGRISAHFAVRDHLADVIAKETTQETAVALLGMVLGSICVRMVGSDFYANWMLFIILMILHQYANYCLVRVLVLDTLNPQRCMIVTEIIMEGINKAADTNSSSFPPSYLSLRHAMLCISPKAVSLREMVYRPLTLSLWGPQLGCSLDSILSALLSLANEEKRYQISENSSTSTSTSSSSSSSISASYTTGTTTTTADEAGDTTITWAKLEEAWKGEAFVVGLDLHGRVSICLKEGCEEAVILKAYLVGCYIDVRLRNHQAEPSSFGRPRSSRKSLPLKDRYHFVLNHVSKDALLWFKCFSSILYSDWNLGSSAALHLGIADALEHVSSNHHPPPPPLSAASTHSVRWMKPTATSELRLLYLCGWDLTEGKLRLGEGPWRYQSSTVGALSVEDDKQHPKSL